METIGDVLERKGRRLHTVGPQSTVVEAVDTMCSAHVGALVVMEGDLPVGIFSERDLMTRVILARLDPAGTLVEEVMTRRVFCVGPNTTVQEAMAIMTDRRCRHLPVMVGGRTCGLISIGDLVRRLSQEKDVELRLLEDYIAGKYPG